MQLCLTILCLVLTLGGCSEDSGDSAVKQPGGTDGSGFITDERIIFSDGLHSEDAFRDANAVYKAEEVCTEVCEGKGKNRTCTVECYMEDGALVSHSLTEIRDIE